MKTGFLLYDVMQAEELARIVPVLEEPIPNQKGSAEEAYHLAEDFQMEAGLAAFAVAQMALVRTEELKPADR